MFQIRNMKLKYDDQLNLIYPCGSRINVKFQQDNIETKYMYLNWESATIIVDWITKNYLTEKKHNTSRHMPPKYNTDDQFSIDLGDVMTEYYGKNMNDPEAYPDFLNALSKFNDKYQLELRAPSQDQLVKGFDGAFDDGETDVWTKNVCIAKWNKALEETKY